MTLTPGTHIYPLDTGFLRAAAPIVVTGETGPSLLLGPGHEYPVGDTLNLVGEVDLIYPLGGEGDGTVTVGGGTSFSF